MGNNYKVGDYVKIKQWDDMAKEYGLGRSLLYGSKTINVSCSFTESMKSTCGQCAKIIGYNGYSYTLKFNNKEINKRPWASDGYNYSEEMFTKITEEEFKEEMKDSVSSQIIELLEKIKKINKKEDK